MSYKLFKKILFIGIFLFLGNSTALALDCPTDNGNGVGCTGGTYYCTGACRAPALVPQCSPYTLGVNNCSDNDPGCGVGCAASTGWGSCGICTSCQAGYLLCSAASGPDKKCAQKGTGVDTNCTICTWNSGSSFTCTNCANGYVLSGGQCLSATLKLGPDSVSGLTTVIQSPTSSATMLLSSSLVSIGTGSTTAGLYVAGASTMADDLSMIHNKSIKINNADADTTLLIGNYGDGMSFGYGASTTRTASLAVEGDVKANRLCIKEDCRAEWTDIQGTSYWTASSTNIYNNNAGNVGVGDAEPYSKLSVSGNISGSGSLKITGTGATTINYITSDLGIGGLPSGGGWARYLDLSGSGNAAYLSRTASVTAALIASETGTPSGTGYNFGYASRQGIIGTLTNQPLNFITNGTSKMFLSADGKLGIGTTTPSALLHVNGSSVFNGTADFRGSVAINTNPDNNSSGFEYGNGYDPGLANYYNERFRVNSFFESPHVSMGVAVNYLLQTEAFNTTNWTKTDIGAVSADTVAAPVGVVTAENIPAGSNSSANIWQAASDSTTGYWSAGVWARAQSGTATIKLRIDSSAEIGTEKTIDLDTQWRFYGVKQNFVTANSSKIFRIISGTNAISLWGARMNPGETVNAYLARTTANQATAVPGVFFNNNTVYATTFSGTLSGTASAAGYSQYGSYFGTTLSNTANKTDNWEYIGAISLSYNSGYANGQSFNATVQLDEQTSSEGVRSFSDLEKVLITIKGNLDAAASGNDFQNAVPRLALAIGGRTSLSSGDVAALVYSNSASAKVIRLYVKLKTANSNYIISPLTGRYCASYNGSMAQSVSYCSFTPAVNQSVVAPLPAPATGQGSVVYGIMEPVVDRFGNLGVGTSSSGYKLDVDGNARFTGTVQVATPATSSDAATKGYVDTAVSSAGGAYWVQSGSNLYASSTSWNVGIGTTSPAAKLHVVGTTTISGYLGIGVTSPVVALDIAGNIRIPTSNFLMFSDGRKLFYDRYYHSTGSFSFTRWNGSSEVYDVTLDNLGNVGIGTTSPGYVLDVNGGARFTGTVKVAAPIDASDAVTKSYLDSALINSTSSNAYVLKSGDIMSGALEFATTTPRMDAINLHGNDIVGVNKITVTTIDPLYDIDGIKYSTYAPSIVGGVKEEYVGRGEIRQCGNDYCSWRLDFSNQEKGSDLWVWRRIIDFQPDKIDVLMTAYGQPASLSYEIDDNQIIFYADRPTKFSYRLVGARFDWRQWPTLAPDQSETTTLIIR